MSRTVITPTTLGPNAGTAPVATTIDASLVTAGVAIAAAGLSGKVLIRVTNTHSSPHDVTVAAGDDPPAFETVALAVTVPATTGVRYIGPLESARAIQDDGTIHLDLDTGHVGALEVYAWPTGY
jgi:hypothetical protein